MFCRITIDVYFVMYLCVYAYVYIHTFCMCVCVIKNKKHAAWPD